VFVGGGIGVSVGSGVGVSVGDEVGVFVGVPVSTGTAAVLAAWILFAPLA